MVCRKLPISFYFLAAPLHDLHARHWCGKQKKATSEGWQKKKGWKWNFDELLLILTRTLICLGWLGARLMAILLARTSRIRTVWPLSNTVGSWVEKFLVIWLAGPWKVYFSKWLKHTHLHFLEFFFSKLSWLNYFIYINLSRIKSYKLLQNLWYDVRKMRRTGNRKCGTYDTSTFNFLMKFLL